MSDLKNAIIKLAYEQPQLREDLLPLLREAGDNDTFKCPDCGTKVLKQTGYCVKCKKKVKESSTKIAGQDLASMVLPHVDVMEMAYKMEDSNRQLLLSVYDTLADRLSVDRKTEEALARVLNVINGRVKRPDDIRNQLGKAANLLGLKTPLIF